MSAPWPRRKLSFPLLLVALALLLRLVHAASVADTPVFLAPTSDEAEHWDMANQLAAGDWLGLHLKPYHRPPLFAYFEAALITLSGGPGPHSFLVLHAALILIDSLAVLAWLGLARRVLPRPAARIGALLIACYGPFVDFAATGYMETFALALNALCLLQFAETLRRLARPASRLSPWPTLLASGLLAGASLMTRPQVLILLPGMLLLLALHIFRNRRRPAAPSQRPWLLIPAFGAAVALVVAPNALRHWTLFGLWAPLGTGSELNFHMANNNDGYGWFEASPGIEYQAYLQFPYTVQPDLPPGDIPALRKFWGQRNRDYLLHHTSEFFSHLGWKSLATLNAYEVHCTQNNLYLRERSPLLRSLPGFGLLIPPGLAAAALLLLPLLRRPLRPPPARILRLLLLLVWSLPYLAGVALFLAVGRHRLPALPPLLLLSGLFFWQFYLLLRRRQWKCLALPFAALAAAALLVHLPVINIPEMQRHERWWTQVNLGVALLSLGGSENLNQALSELHAGIVIHPEEPETWRQLSNVHSALGQWREAADARQRLLELFTAEYPRHTDIQQQVRQRLAEFRFQAGQYPESETLARQGIAIYPNDTAFGNLLAVSLMAQKRPAEARPVLEAILARDPENSAAQKNLRLIEEKN